MSARETYWLAYYEDWSGFAVFDTELRALRHANGTQMVVVEIPFGVSIREFVQETSRIGEVHP